jgi:hypothetical protein
METGFGPLIRVILEVIASIFLILFGILFLVFLPLSVSELATDAIFIGAGALIMRKAILDRRHDLLEKNASIKPRRKAGQNDTRKRRTGKPNEYKNPKE